MPGYRLLIEEVLKARLKKLSKKKVIRDFLSR